LLQKDDVDELASELVSRDFLVTVETNGTIVPRERDFIFWSVSPKLSNSGMLKYLNVKALERFAMSHSQFKFVVEKLDDVYEAMSLMRKLKPYFATKKAVIFQPQTFHARSIDEYFALMRNIAECAKRWSKSYSIRVLPQLHRLMYGLEARGV